MVRSLLIAGILAAATAMPDVVAAREYDRDDVVTDTVFVADLDLSTGRGMDRLINRLRTRIESMCATDGDCRDQAWLSADWQVARELGRARWRQRVAYEREIDRRQYRPRGSEPSGFRKRPPTVSVAPRPTLPPPVVSDLPVAIPVARTVTTTTQTVSIRTTTVTLTYRLPPPGDESSWAPR